MSGDFYVFDFNGDFSGGRMPENTDVARLMNIARVRLPGALDTAMKVELFEVTKEFFELTNAWRVNVAVTTIANTQTYDMASSQPTGGIFKRLLALKDSNKNGVLATLQMPTMLVLDNTPTTVDTLTATVAVVPEDPVDANSNPQCPAWIFATYNQTLVDGLLGRMMSQIAKTYTNAKMAEYHMKRFRTAAVKAKVEANRGFNYRRQAWTFPQSFAVRNHRA